MICDFCEKDKLSNEFPCYQLTDNCDHAVLHCLRCVTTYVQKKNRCSQCGTHVREDNERYQECMKTLQFLFPKLEVTPNIKQRHEQLRLIYQLNISVETLSGESATFDCISDQPVQDLKKRIEKTMGIASNKQRLLYNNKELMVTNDRHASLTLRDHQIPDNATLYLMVLLYELPEGLDVVVFDLSWGFPPRRKYGRRKFLDTTAFLFSGYECVGFVDFRNITSDYCETAIRHSGKAEMDFDSEVGSNSVTAYLNKIPDEIDRLVFTLSAYNAQNLSNYPQPSLKFYDAKQPDILLCSDEMSQGARSQAIVMCSLTKQDGKWVAISAKGAANGSAKNYSPLVSKIQSLIRKGFI